MALSHDLTTTNAGGFSNSISYSHTTSGSDRILIVAVYLGNATTISNTVTYGAVSMSLGKRQQGNSRGVELWYLPNPLSGANTVLVSLNGSIQNSSSATSLNGGLQVSPMGITGGANGSSNAPSVTATSNINNSWIVDGVSFGSFGATATTTGSNQTERADFSGGSSSFQAYSSTKTTTTAGSQTSSWSSAPTSANWAQAAIEIKEAVATTNSNFLAIF